MVTILCALVAIFEFRVRSRASPEQGHPRGEKRPADRPRRFPPPWSIVENAGRDPTPLRSPSVAEFEIRYLLVKVASC
jgi:hypothetical protein